MEVAMDPMEDVQVPSSPVPAAKKMRRLRKVRETEIKENDEVGEVGVVSEKVNSDEEVRAEQRETAEEILKRFGKGGGEDGGKKRKAVQRTIVAAVVDMSKQTEVVGVEEVEGEPPIEDNVEDEDGGLELPIRGEELDVGSEENAPLSKKKRSNTVKRCLSHATGMTFESASCEDKDEAMDGIENETVIDGEIKENDQEGTSDAENDNEGTDDGGVASDSEKGNVGNDDAGGLNAGGSNGGWSDGWAQEGMSMDSILEKARKMVAAMSNPGAASAKPTKEKKNTSEEDSTGIDEQNGKKKKSKKEEERIKREEIYAESQRLLRESKGVAFVAPAPVTKPVSSVLEKIRQRRLQLGCSGAGTASSQEFEMKAVVSRRATKGRSSRTHVDLTVDGDTEVEIEVFSSTVVKTEEVRLEVTAFDVEVQNKPAQEVSRDMEEVEIAKAQDDTARDKKTPDTPEGQQDFIRDDSASSRPDERSHLRLEPSLFNMDTQDLFCTSELSAATEESLESTPFESVGTTTATDLMGLDTQLLDEDLMPRPMRDNHHQEYNKETGLRTLGLSEIYTSATHVRGLIDDEAEDEDEDILAENAEEEEILGDEDDLRDLIAGTEKEKAGDKARRDALHRKWLDQQDTEQTEDILERLRTGRSTRWRGRERVVSCLDEDDDLVNSRDSESLEKNSLSSQAGADNEPSAEEDLNLKPSISLRQRTRSQDLEMDCLLDEYDDLAREEEPVVEDEIIEDEEEHEQSIIRQRMLEESEEQLVFLSPADDDSSREVFSLITKVNVGNLKTKSTPGQSEIRATTSSSLPSRPSFLGRNASSSSLPPPAHRHVSSGGSSRSFVFGRDDSNSGHGFPSNQSLEEKKPGVFKSVPDQGVLSSASTIGGKKRPISQPTSGPSLFEMLKKQSKELEQDLKKTTSAIAKKWGSNTEAFSMFATKKSAVNAFRRKL